MKSNIRIVHIIDKISEKNISILQVINNLKKYSDKKFNFKTKIITSIIQKKFFFKKNDMIIINENKFIFDYSALYNKIKNTDIVHIHGMWSYFNILSIFITLYFNKKLIIHPHGMLLEEAINNSIFFKRILKKIILFFLKYLLNKNCLFVAITKKEQVSINYFFINKIIIIPNTIEIKKLNKKIKLNNHFVFFGRINKIKNLDLLIKSFLQSKLDKTYKLFLYLIDDDQELKLKLKKLVGQSKYIIFKKPVFGKLKDEILQKSWVNVLLSKSEVNSYSVLEASSLEVPSVVTKNISIKNFQKNGGVVTNKEIEDIVKKFKSVSSWKLADRLKMGKKIRRFILRLYSQKKIYKKYDFLYNDIS